MGDQEQVAGRPRQYAEGNRGKRIALEGRVISTKMQKTIVVAIERTFKHAKYGKYIRRHHKVYAHDEKGEAREGDFVRVTEARPMSRLKRFTLTSVIKRGGEA